MPYGPPRELSEYIIRFLIIGPKSLNLPAPTKDHSARTTLLLICWKLRGWGLYTELYRVIRESGITNTFLNNSKFIENNRFIVILPSKDLSWKKTCLHAAHFRRKLQLKQIGTWILASHFGIHILFTVNMSANIWLLCIPIIPTRKMVGESGQICIFDPILGKINLWLRWN